MNLAQHLEAAGREHPGLPAVGLGTRILHDYAALAARVARLAGALTHQFKLAPGDRVAIAAKNAPEYLETL